MSLHFLKMRRRGYSVRTPKRASSFPKDLLIRQLVEHIVREIKKVMVTVDWEKLITTDENRERTFNQKKESLIMTIAASYQRNRRVGMIDIDDMRVIVRI